MSSTLPTRLDDLRQRREEILSLAAHYHAYNVRVIGSVARGEATVSSDIDFLVNYEHGASLLDLAGLWQDLQTLLQHSVDVLDEASLPPYWQAIVRQESVPL